MIPIHCRECSSFICCNRYAVAALQSAMSKPKDSEPIDAADRIRRERLEYQQIAWISQSHTFTNDLGDKGAAYLLQQFRGIGIVSPHLARHQHPLVPITQTAPTAVTPAQDKRPDNCGEGEGSVTSCSVTWIDSPGTGRNSQSRSSDRAMRPKDQSRNESPVADAA